MTILVGDSGVGKTSLLVQFDQGKFIPGSFSATVGIGFTIGGERFRRGRELEEGVVTGSAVADGAMPPLQEYGVPFMETSAKTGMNVELAFLAIAKELKQRAVQQPDEPRFQIQDYIESQKKKSSCCSFM
ncbi:hypothetical protein KIL84_004160 [Mauremys mutica]|uniref:Ras-related protein Rab-37 n=1 Tax=Mauremys mutica TaxID=74926 RepID=A0A9D4B612_9SAUR|nr:hypothetical protein KIL84_004160 [Mauremys mutica]